MSYIMFLNKSAIKVLKMFFYAFLQIKITSEMQQKSVNKWKDLIVG